MRNFLLLVVSCLFYVSPVRAEKLNQFITVVNPVRISAYSSDPVASIKAQYGVINKFNLPATWLVTYDVLDNQNLVHEIKSFDKNQEMGIFLEVTPNFAKAANISYNDSGSWHYSNSVLFSGYSQAERLKLIDTVFNKFKDQFGYYPTSIGSWWTDAYSLGMIKEKYSVTANLGVSDQFKTDGYQVWGQYWSTPFYPSKNHPALPAGSLENKLDLVTIQWAPRDPYWGYLDSLYSTQDYFTAPKQNIDYYIKLLYLYASKHNNKFGQITVGLEGDFSANSYSGIFFQQMLEVKKLISTGNYLAVTMNQFSNWYRNEFPKLSPEQLIVSDDLLGGPIQATWFQSPQYRIGLFRDKSTGTTKLIDLRVYSDSLTDPYLSFVNGNNNLFINVPSSVDMISKPGSEVMLSSEEINFDQIVKKYSKQPPQQVVFNDYSLRIPYALRSRIGNISNNVLVLLLIGSLVLMFCFFKSSRAIILIFLLGYFIYFSRISYFISSYEIDALNYLKNLPLGNVMVYDKDCLRCVWTSPHQPASLANKRDYVGKISKHNLIYDDSFLLAADGGQGKLILKKNKVLYLYLVKYGDYEENAHFSPTDLNISKMYENANAVIWRFNESSD